MNNIVTQTLLPQALRVFVGTGARPVRSKRELPSLADAERPPVFSLSPSRELTETLKDKGYTHLRSFVSIPSHSTPRWLLPIGARDEMLAGTHIYQPYKWAPRVIKSVFIALIKMGWHGPLRSRVLVASREMLPLEALVYDVTGEDKPLFVLSLGRQAAIRKLTVQVMRPNGAILGYIKLPLMAEAAERVRNEARTLERLWSFPTLRPHIPRLLYAGDWNDTYLLFQSALHGERGPLIFNGMHDTFLHMVREVHSVAVPGRTLIGQIATNWDKAVRHLGTEWAELGKEVLRRSIHGLQGKMLRCGLMHGDFAPWNTLVAQNKLLLFDWESADWEAPTSWDIFHFQVQTSYFFEKRKWSQVPPAYQHSEEISFMLYVLKSVCQFLEEDNHRAISHHKQLLISRLHARQAEAETATAS